MNTKKIFKSISNDKFEIIDELQNNRQILIEAIHIMESIINNKDSKEQIDVSIKRMSNFFKKYEI